LKSFLTQDQIARAWKLYLDQVKQAHRERVIVSEWEESLAKSDPGWRRSSSQLAALESHRAAMRDHEAMARSVVPLLRCGSKTRLGSPCQCKPVEGKRRCKLHGGLSTGPKTQEGRARIGQLSRDRARARRDVLEETSVKTT
jgi:hypothetical protein